LGECSGPLVISKTSIIYSAFRSEDTLESRRHRKTARKYAVFEPRVSGRNPPSNFGRLYSNLAYCPMCERIWLTRVRWPPRGWRKSENLHRGRLNRINVVSAVCGWELTKF